MLYRGDDPIQDRSAKNRPVFGLSSSFGEPQQSACGPSPFHDRLSSLPPSILNLRVHIECDERHSRLCQRRHYSLYGKFTIINESAPMPMDKHPARDIPECGLRRWLGVRLCHCQQIPSKNKLFETGK
jgi:hypothetical protein